MFEIGQHVVCVDDDYTKRVLEIFDIYDGSLPVRGTVYTVREVFAWGAGHVSIRLAELVNLKMPVRDFGMVEPGFNPSRFRPLKKLKVEDFMTQGVDA